MFSAGVPTACTDALAPRNMQACGWPTVQCQNGCTVQEVNELKSASDRKEVRASRAYAMAMQMSETAPLQDRCVFARGGVRVSTRVRTCTHGNPPNGSRRAAMQCSVLRWRWQVRVASSIGGRRAHTNTHTVPHRCLCNQLRSRPSELVRGASTNACGRRRLAALGRVLESCLCVRHDPLLSVRWLFGARYPSRPRC